MEIKKPRSKSILVSTWYRPPDSPVSHYAEFEQMIGSFDAENLEYFLLGDLNVDFKCQWFKFKFNFKFNFKINFKF